MDRGRVTWPVTLDLHSHLGTPRRLFSLCVYFRWSKMLPSPVFVFCSIRLCPFVLVLVQMLDDVLFVFVPWFVHLVFVLDSPNVSPHLLVFVPWFVHLVFVLGSPNVSPHLLVFVPLFVHLVFVLDSPNVSSHLLVLVLWFVHLVFVLGSQSKR